MKYILRGGPYDNKQVEYNFITPKLIYVECDQTKSGIPNYYIEHTYQTRDLTASTPFEADYVGIKKREIKYIDSFNNRKST